MKDYMKTRYRLKPDVKKAHKLLMNTRYVTNKYEINPQVKEKYKNYLYYVVNIKQMIDELPADVFQSFLQDYKEMEFRPL